MSNLTPEEEEALSLQLAMQLQEEWNKQSSGGQTGNVAGDAGEKAGGSYVGLTEEEKKQLVREQILLYPPILTRKIGASRRAWFATCNEIARRRMGRETQTTTHVDASSFHSHPIQAR